ncbi:hypothetical protein TROPICALSUN_18 [Erwinia phage vB_EamM_TropicalSun]|uniref:Uncharacterized protein n=4 Tax=Myosmarvirus TaxID=2843428 RepID=A0A9E8JUM7_9CAUD|nr:hypothetical protein HWC56_gp076 [Serratia phage MyoSmar]QEG09525.1 hypothetical protein CPT_MyoSmar_076 [Serratia phage MyoSmar]QEG13808.1 hypothetical protein TROPICALSUN_18 [Erwinia phage vB_EamM_TropicalSun]UZS00418.1 hypothetical protein [Serratia phage SMP]
MIYVLSKMTNAVSYRIYQDVAGLPTPVKSITIHGGASLPSEKSGFGDMHTTEDGRPIWTAEGSVTKISDADYAVLKDHPMFKSHIENNHLKVVTYDISENNKEIRRLSNDMEDDGRRQLNKETMATKVKATTVKSSSDDDNRI